MGNSIANISGVPDLGQNVTAQTPSGGEDVSASTTTAGTAASGQVKPAPESESHKQASQAPVSHGADMRLVIEDDKAAGCFVYKIVNRKTGEVVQQLPQEQMLKLREADGYLAGDVIKTQA
ncbi:MAG: flagellar protein FlaG [Caulobacteraceae bacterium]|nr:flagellar protein FlaG [Caulobacteraceae bacterium]